MGNEERWNTFARTGRVSDYLHYADHRKEEESSVMNQAEREREKRERTSDGNGVVGGYHW